MWSLTTPLLSTTVIYFCCRLLLRCMRAREREHTICATVPGPRHSSNTTLSISRLLVSRPPARATIRAPAPRGRSGGKGRGERGREGEGRGRKWRGEGGESAAYMYLSILILRPACAAILRVFVQSVSMFLFSCVSVAFCLSLHRPLSSRFHLLLVAFACALVSRAFPALAPLAAHLLYRLPYRSFSYTFAL
jgi:hypothetical protein